MEGIPLSTKIDFTRDVISAGHAIDLGVVEKTARAGEKYWMHWSCYSKSVGIDPLLLEHTDPLIRDVVITAFAARVRSGYYSCGREIRVSEVTEAISAISKTIELAGYQSPVYRSPNVYNLSIQRLVKGYRREDPPSVPQLAVPVPVPDNMADIAYLTECPLLHAIADLAIIAFYYLLRIGEYTVAKMIERNGRKIISTCTVQFMVGNIGFFHKGNKVIEQRSPLAELLECDQCTYKITNQKSGRMGQTISHEGIMNHNHGPVKATARRVHHILSYGGDETTIISAYLAADGTWKTVSSVQMRSGVRTSVKQLDLHKNGIDANLVGVHSLHAGGAIALKLAAGESDTTIQKYGRWSSTTFLDYIHNQITHLSKSISTTK